MSGSAEHQADGGARRRRSARFAARAAAALAEARRRRSASSDAGSRRRSCRCTPRRPTPGDRTRTPSSFISSSLSIGSLPRASARLTTTRSTPRARTIDGNVVDRADDAGVEHRRADPRRIGIDEADDLDAELVPALEELARQRRPPPGSVPTSSSRSRGPTLPASATRTPTRQPTTSAMTSTAAITKTPRPMIRLGNQK